MLRIEDSHDPLEQRIHRQLWDTHELVGANGAAVVAIQPLKSFVQTLDLVGSN